MFRRSLSLCLALLAAGTLSCGQKKSGVDAVVMIVIDTLRADHVGCYGWTAATTPHLDALAARGLRFAKAMTPVPVTLPAVSSLLTGRLPFHHRVRDNERYVLPEEEVTLAERFHDAGWRTGAVLGSAILASDRGVSQGFETYEDAFQPPFPVYHASLEVFAEDFGRTQRRADVVTDLALRQAKSFGKDPFFLFVHYFDVHSYYDPPPPHGAQHPGRPYDGEISFVDAEIGRLLAGLESRHPLVVVVADHGEGLGEHGETQHGFLLYESTLGVPIIVAGPGVPTGLVRNDPVSLIDLAPTLVASLQLPENGPAWDGRRLVWDRPESAQSDLYAETCRTLVSYGWSELRALRRGSRKLISGPRSEVYDLEQDPSETHPIADPAQVSELQTKLSQLTHGETREAILSALGRANEPERHELLESLGYLTGDEPEPASDGRTYPDPHDELPRWEMAQKEKALYRRGMTFATHGRYPEAIAVFDTVLAHEPDRADVYYNRGLARRKLGDEAGFRGDLAASLRADSRYVPALTARANDEERSGDAHAARDTWKRILELEPVNTSALQGLSEGYLRQNAYNEALPYLRRLVSATPEDAPARLNLGLAAAKAGRKEEAREHIEAFLRLAPGDPRAAELQKLLSELR